MLDWLTPTQWGTFFGMLSMGTVVVLGFAMLHEVFRERRTRDGKSRER